MNTDSKLIFEAYQRNRLIINEVDPSWKVGDICLIKGDPEALRYRIVEAPTAGRGNVAIELENGSSKEVKYVSSDDIEPDKKVITDVDLHDAKEDRELRQAHFNKLSQ